MTVSNRKLVWQGTVAIFPLSVAVIPWGFLVGSFAVDSGLSWFESQALSTILYAGAAQLVAIGMLKAGVGIGTMLLTTFFITSRHFLYSVSMRSKIATLPLKWRIVLGFLLTDELFAIVGNQTPERFKPWYAFGAGFSFYMVWNIATLVGIIAGSQIPNLDQFGLEFAVAATFIALVVPTIKNLAVLVSVIVALVFSVTFAYFHVEGGLMISGLFGMFSGFMCESLTKGRDA